MAIQSFIETYSTTQDTRLLDEYAQSFLNPAEIEKMIRDPKNIFLAMEVNGSFVGYSKLKPAPDPNAIYADKKTIHLERIYLLKASQSRGLGKALLAASFEEARKRGFEVAWLNVWFKNQKAIDFYNRMGFVRAGDTYFQLGTESNLNYVFAQSLTPPL